MINISSPEDFTAASGIFDTGVFEGLYHSLMDEAFNVFGANRPKAILHLEPSIVENSNDQSGNQPQMYNSFFGRPALPSINTRNSGVEVEHRDIEFTVMSRIGPKDSDDTRGIGALKENEIQLTFVIEALPYIKEALSVSYEGRRYKIDSNRPIGFSERRYIIVHCSEINEEDVDQLGNNG